MLAKQRYPVLLLILLLLGTALLIGCQGQPEQVEADTLTPATLRLDWTSGAQHSPFYLAKERGYYEDEGIDLEIVSGSGSSDAVKQLGSGAIDFGLIDGLVIVQSIEQDVPVTTIGAYYQRSPITLMSPASDPVDDPSDLLGDVQLGSKKGSATYQGLIVFLAANDIKLEDINLVDVGFGVQPLLVGQVDALMGFTMNEPIEAETQGMDVYELLVADYGVDAYGLTLATNNEFMAENPELVEGFLRATQRGMEAAEEEPQAAIDALMNQVEDLNEDRELQVLEKTVPFWHSDATDEHSLGWQTEEGWQSTADTALTLELISTELNASDIYTNDFLE
jgi:NitT/TauT family transport system substrate-binding protein